MKITIFSGSFLDFHHFCQSFSPPLLKKGDILLHGHTHVPICKQTETFTYLNPGSVSIPKEGSCHSYMTLENGTFLWKDLNGDVYNRFDL